MKATTRRGDELFGSRVGLCAFCDKQAAGIVNGQTLVGSTVWIHICTPCYLRAGDSDFKLKPETDEVH